MPASALTDQPASSARNWVAFGVRTIGDAYDNAMCESFFATLECELIDRRRFRSHSEARMAVFQFIEGFYNPSRRHSALSYLSPNEYERKQLAGCCAGWVGGGEGLGLLENWLGCTLPESQQESGLSVGAVGPQGASRWRDYPRRSVRARSFAP